MNSEPEPLGPRRTSWTKFWPNTRNRTTGLVRRAAQAVRTAKAQGHLSPGAYPGPSPGPSHFEDRSLERCAEQSHCPRPAIPTDILDTWNLAKNTSAPKHLLGWVSTSTDSGVSADGCLPSVDSRARAANQGAAIDPRGLEAGI
jgi:hypothetical protein